MAWRLHPPTENEPNGVVTECDDDSTLPAGARWISEVEAIKLRQLTPVYPAGRILAERRIKRAKAGIERAMKAGMSREVATQTAVLLLDVDPAKLKSNNGNNANNSNDANASSKVDN